MKKLKTLIANSLGRTTVFLAMSVAFATTMDWPCLIIGGEPEVPESLKKVKNQLYGDN